MIPPQRLIPLLVLLAAAPIACQRPPTKAVYTHPTELVGRWVRLHADGTWGDTLEYLADGAVHGSVGNPVPPSARWAVKSNAVTGPQFCAGDSSDAYCQTYHLAGDRMVLDGGPSGNTTFRHVP